MKPWIYDIECLPNVFTVTALNVASMKWYEFEVSPRKNDTQRIAKWVNYLRLEDATMVGFNSIHYDYPMLHYLMTQLSLTGGAKYITSELYQRSQDIFISGNLPGLGRFAYNVWESEHLVKQVDLFKIHHFDNKARLTSLKRLQFNMRLKSIVEFELDFNKPMTTSAEIDSLLEYNRYDVLSTYEFYLHTQGQIDFRTQLSNQFERSFMNFNDTKIGEVYMTIELERSVGKHVLKDEDGNRRGTPRDVINIGDILFDNITFKHPAFNRVLNLLKETNVTVADGKFHWCHGEVIPCILDGFRFDIGKGGLHGARNNSVYRSSESHVIKDVDVTSFYPSIGIEYGLYPEHLTSAFVQVYGGVKGMRLSHPKGTVENAMLKLALNGTYGKTNSEFSVFYDPQYTLATTINGQLLLCMLWDQLRHIEDIDIIQANTDGITLYYPRVAEDEVKAVCDQWSKDTKMVLEDVIYDKMCTRDVNNYLCKYEGGGVKAKGAYVYAEMFDGTNGAHASWNKNHSEVVVAKAASAALLDGIPVDKFIVEHTDLYDFFLCTNVNRGATLHIGDGWESESVPHFDMDGNPHLDKDGKPKSKTRSFLKGENEKIQRVSRYLITRNGGRLTKRMNPIRRKAGAFHIKTGAIYDDIRMAEKNSYAINYRHIGINADEVVTVLNTVPDGATVDGYDIDYAYYINKALKLTEVFS